MAHTAEGRGKGSSDPGACARDGDQRFFHGYLPQSLGRSRELPLPRGAAKLALGLYRCDQKGGTTTDASLLLDRSIVRAGGP